MFSERFTWVRSISHGQLWGLSHRSTSLLDSQAWMEHNLLWYHKQFARTDNTHYRTTSTHNWREKNWKLRINHNCNLVLYTKLMITPNSIAHYPYNNQCPWMNDTWQHPTTYKKQARGMSFLTENWSPLSTAHSWSIVVLIISILISSSMKLSSSFN